MPLGFWNVTASCPHLPRGSKKPSRREIPALPSDQFERALIYPFYSIAVCKPSQKESWKIVLFSWLAHGIEDRYLSSGCIAGGARETTTFMCGPITDVYDEYAGSPEARSLDSWHC